MRDQLIIFIECENNIVYSDDLKINYSFPDTDLRILVNGKEYNVKKDGTISYILSNEGSNFIKIEVYNQSEKIREVSENIYYIKPYESQFAENISKTGIQVHYRDGTMEKYNMSKKQLFALGVKNVRSDF